MESVPSDGAAANASPLRQHPFLGAAIARPLARRLRLSAGQRVLEIGGEPGACAPTLAAVFGCHVVAVYGDEASAARARSAAQARGVGRQVSAVCAQLGEALPFADGGFDAVVAVNGLDVCAGQPHAAALVGRLLRPGGRVGLTGAVVAGEERDRVLAGPVDALTMTGAAARPLHEYVTTLAAAGLRTVRVERHDTVLGSMIRQTVNRLTWLRISGDTALPSAELDRALELAGETAHALRRGTVGYGLLVAERPPAAPSDQCGAQQG